jgi:acyl carrier protein
MNEMRRRLAQCFSLVFPGLREPEAYSASVASLARWDSTAAIMLASVIEEEFHIEMDYDVLPELTSFDLILQYLEKEQGDSA